MTPWAEILRAEDRQTREQALAVRYPLWVVRVELDEEPATLTFDNCERFGLEPRDLVADDHSACQKFAEEQRALNDGLRVFTAPTLSPVIWLTSRDDKPLTSRSTAIARDSSGKLSRAAISTCRSST